MFPLPNVGAATTAASAGAYGAGNVSTPHMGYKSGRYYNPAPLVGTETATGLALSTGNLYFYPFYVHSDVNISGLVVANSGTPTQNLAVGVYSNSNGAPSSLEIAPSAIALGGAAATREFVVSSLLAKGWHWFAVTVDGAVTLNGLDPVGPLAGWSANSMTTATEETYAKYAAVRSTFVYGALPAAAPAIAASSLTAQPRYQIKVA